MSTNTEIKTYQKRIADTDCCERDACLSEIADLRAALEAAQQQLAQQEKAVAHVSRDDMGFYEIYPDVGWAELPEGTKLFTAPPAAVQAAAMAAQPSEQAAASAKGEPK